MGYCFATLYQTLVYKSREIRASHKRLYDFYLKYRVKLQILNIGYVLRGKDMNS